MSKTRRRDPNWVRLEDRPFPQRRRDLWRFAQNSDGEDLIHTPTPLMFMGKESGQLHNRADARRHGMQSRAGGERVGRRRLGRVLTRGPSMEEMDRRRQEDEISRREIKRRSIDAELLD